ncbi:MAG: efflux RND transporter periplasmic adaptor subunit [Agitococcus sp.]|nr:efflux RND transporter periplasmic adaptor subunit [Agitococcus sp.]
MKLPIKQIATAIGVLLLMMILAYAWQKTGDTQAHQHDELGGHHAQESASEVEKGSHGGRLFRADNFTLEVKIFEQGVEPQLRLYAFDNNKIIAPQNVQAQVLITRLDATQTLNFRPEADYLLGDAIVYEPHSFAVQVKASYAGKNYVFDWQQEEGRLTLPAASLVSNGIELLSVRPQALTESLSLQGEVQIRPERDVAVLARVAGVVLSINKPLGAAVKKGDVLAILESRELASLRASLYSAQQRLILAQEHFHHQDTLLQQNMIPEHEYVTAKTQLAEAQITVTEAKSLLKALGAEATGGTRLTVRAPINGVVVDNKLAVGQAVNTDSVLVRVADLSALIAVVNVPEVNINALRLGMSAQIKSQQGQTVTQGKISYLGAVLGEDTRSAPVFISLNNPSQQWRAGQLVQVDIVQNTVTVPMAIREDALQTFRDWQVVFVRVGEQFEVRPLELGRRTNGYIEVLSGLQPNQVYGAGNSFLLKAELGKAGASHDH